ncbi:hypothetical protein [Nocardioides bruguierae]|uniref:hypothetical protein n=1 Tax=Nocardioides bruguierae TaxID=2945102 RepID=UPI0020226617|nr:hypothetical protein [Nocardioides bruguierae]MCL8026961.1 hypothetical protein [Nocardioides bruguierae]
MEERQELPSQAIVQADSAVAPEGTLWAQFLGELGKYGMYRAAVGGLQFQQRGESGSRLFVISPTRLRDAFVRDIAYHRLRGDHVDPVERLPQWFLDGLFEFIGAIEEPYDHRFVVLVGLQFQPADEEQYALRDQGTGT